MGSISKAARKLFVTQPALSVKIQEMERYYQEKLLERTNRGIKPTEVGLLVYQHGKKIVSLTENIQTEIQRNRNPIQELFVGASSTIGNYALPCTVYNFKERHPYYKIIMNISNSEHVIEKVLNRRVEMGVVEGPVSEQMKQTLNHEGIRMKKVARSELVLAVPNNEYWKETKSIDLETFRKLPLIIREPGSGIRATLEASLQANELTLADLNVVMELNTINSIISAVAADKGVSLLPKMAIRKELSYKILKSVHVEEIYLQHDITTLFHPTETSKQLYETFLTFLHSKDRGFC
jgi:DNA-binding transcriptional LysR family regulator